MKANIMNPNVVEMYNIPQVTNPVHFDRGGTPTPDGLFSYEIFGRAGSSERERVCAYIDMKEKFIHPLVYNALIRLNRNAVSCISGDKTFKIVDGNLKEDPDGETGLRFLIANWKKLNFAKSDSIQRNNRVDMTNMSPNIIFTDKQIVIPPFYRDINFEANTHDVINDMYAKLLRLIKALELNSGAELGNTGNITRYNIQICLNNIYEYFTSKIKGSDGHFHQAVLGKSVDNCARLVITAPQYSAETYKETVVSFRYCGVPIAQFCSLFFPFVISKLEKWFKDNYEMRRSIKVYRKKTGKIEEYDLAEDCMKDFDYEHLMKAIKKFMKTPSERFELIQIKTVKGYIPMYFVGNRNNAFTKESDIQKDLGFTRELTWLDLLYQVCYEIAEDKHVYITRYPLIDYFGIFVNRINLLSTKQTQTVWIDGKEYKHYPVIDLSMPKEKLANNFYDSLQMSNIFLTGLGGDYDGDQVTVRGVWSQQANDEAEQILNSRRNIFTSMGNSLRDVNKDAVQGIHAFTKRVG